MGLGCGAQRPMGWVQDRAHAIPSCWGEVPVRLSASSPRSTLHLEQEELRCPQSAQGTR